MKNLFAAAAIVVAVAVPAPTAHAQAIDNCTIGKQQCFPQGQPAMWGQQPGGMYVCQATIMNLKHWAYTGRPCPLMSRPPRLK